MFIDTHAHLVDRKMLPPAEVLENAKKAGVTSIIVCGTSLEDSKKELEIAEKFPEVFCALGVHPHEAKDYSEEFEKFIKQQAGNKKVVAIGEIGLDYFYNFSDKQTQKDVFIKQLILAHEFKLPVILHVRDAYEDCFNILKQNKALLTEGILFHCYSGSAEFMLNIVKEFKDVYFAFGGAITFKNNKKGIEVLQQIDLGRIVLETDCPYLSPEPFRGRINEPKNIPLIARKIGDILGRSEKEVGRISTENAKKFFRKIG